MYVHYKSPTQQAVINFPLCNDSRSAKEMLLYCKQSLEELGPIILMLKEVKGESVTEVPIILVGNKKDEDQVSSELGQKLATKWGTGFIETSAKDNENITELFQRLLAMEKKRTLALTMDEESGKSGAKRKCSLM
uniref:Uncharacterized protein n=1 Tax=Setaria digitata TaxID=48799 RepID=A0A915PLQ7_9BILA